MKNSILKIIEMRYGGFFVRVENLMRNLVVKILNFSSMSDIFKDLI